MILKIRSYPDPVLRIKAEEIKEINKEIESLVGDMLETMYFYKGIGLAAPQIGVSKRVFVVDVGEGPKVFINSNILKKKGEILFEEGCLSVPKVYLKIKRAKEIEIEALDEKGRKFKFLAKGLLAICLQQEMDHLQGILIIDKINIWKKLKIKYFKK